MYMISKGTAPLPLNFLSIVLVGARDLQTL
jgi:hypothetical protein